MQLTVPPQERMIDPDLKNEFLAPAGEEREKFAAKLYALYHGAIQYLLRLPDKKRRERHARTEQEARMLKDQEALLLWRCVCWACAVTLCEFSFEAGQAGTALNSFAVKKECGAACQSKYQLPVIHASRTLRDQAHARRPFGPFLAFTGHDPTSHVHHISVLVITHGVQPRAPEMVQEPLQDEAAVLNNANDLQKDELPIHHRPAFCRLLFVAKTSVDAARGLVTTK
eukprot:scaffold18588_cov17-Tisochrysis_lutea.AAC.1